MIHTLLLSLKSSHQLQLSLIRRYVILSLCLLSTITTATLSSSPLPSAALPPKATFLKPTQKNNQQQQPAATAASRKKKIILIDVDNTLYSEPNHQIEKQIIKNTHKFCQNDITPPLSPEQCDNLFRTYGTTVEGLRHLKYPPRTISEFYQKVYRDINVSSLSHLPANNSDDDETKNDDDPNILTGYNPHHPHNKKNTLHFQLRRHLSLLVAHPDISSVYLASNSPRYHVKRILSAMGLSDVPFSGILTPCEDNNFCTKAGGGGGGDDNPRRFYKEVLLSSSSSKNEEVELNLWDDSVTNLKAAQMVGINGCHITNGPEGLIEAIAAMVLPSQQPSAAGLGLFDEVSYLRGKNEMDVKSLNRHVWHSFIDRLSRRCRSGEESTTLRIVDLGAGLLSMLKLLLNGWSDDDDGMTGMTKKETTKIRGGLLPLPLTNVTIVEYHAYETNRKLLPEIQKNILQMGFQPLLSSLSSSKDSDDDDDDKFTYELIIPSQSSNDNATTTTTVILHLHLVDFQTTSFPSSSSTTTTTSPDAIIGCCFADLFSSPSHLLATILKFSHFYKSPSSPMLLYFPITFDGITALNPPHGIEKTSTSDSMMMIPSDAIVMNAYTKTLIKRGHNPSVHRLIRAAERMDVSVVASGSSPWEIISPNQQDDKSLNDVYNAFQYFFASSGMLEELMMEDNDDQGDDDGDCHYCRWDGDAWWRRFEKEKPGIWVKNVDLLLQLSTDDDDDGGRQMKDCSHGNGKKKKKDEEEVKDVEEIEFVAPREVRAKKVKWSVKDNEHLGEGQMEVTSLYSLISTGTELKIFHGDFSPTQPLDTTLPTLSAQTLSYPLSYGYSLVGRVTAIGPNVPSHLLHKLVFLFAPHASHTIVDYNEVMIVPEGIHPLDAVFLPSVETAVSVVHDAGVRMGEMVGVWGQGLIGLLVTSILDWSHKASSSSSATTMMTRVRVYDTILERLALAAGRAGASEALLPSSSHNKKLVDVAIEVSGHPRALQSAIDATKDGGRIVIASWYGDVNEMVKLRLGLDFHRSRKTIITSQVSELPPAMTKLWSKARRFDLVWELIRVLKPRTFLLTRVVDGLDKAGEVYTALSEGREMCCAFRYGGGEKQ